MKVGSHCTCVSLSLVRVCGRYLHHHSRADQSRAEQSNFRLADLLLGLLLFGDLIHECAGSLVPRCIRSRWGSKTETEERLIKCHVIGPSDDEPQIARVFELACTRA